MGVAVDIKTAANAEGLESSQARPDSTRSWRGLEIHLGHQWLISDSGSRRPGKMHKPTIHKTLTGSKGRMRLAPTVLLVTAALVTAACSATADPTTTAAPPVGDVTTATTAPATRHRTAADNDHVSPGTTMGPIALTVPEVSAQCGCANRGRVAPPFQPVGIDSAADFCWDNGVPAYVST